MESSLASQSSFATLSPVNFNVEGLPPAHKSGGRCEECGKPGRRGCLFATEMQSEMRVGLEIQSTSVIQKDNNADSNQSIRIVMSAASMALICINGPG